jgi:hypothetical protein
MVLMMARWEAVPHHRWPKTLKGELENYSRKPREDDNAIFYLHIYIRIYTYVSISINTDKGKSPGLLFYV